MIFTFYEFIIFMNNFSFRALWAIILVLGLPAICVADEFVNFIGMKFVDIPSGSFYMGSCTPEQAASGKIKCPAKKFFRKIGVIVPEDETPRHQVSISDKIQFGVHEVTVGSFYKFLEERESDPLHEDYIFKKINSSEDKNGGFPVRFVSWNDVQRFINWLNTSKPAEDKGKYRLPTEAEWEYAARSGSDKVFFFGNNAKQLEKYCWFSGNCRGKGAYSPRAVGTVTANTWGIYDMYGNVGEWVQDYYEASFYEKSIRTENPVNIGKSILHVVRGGACNYDARYCRSAVRSMYPGSQKSSFIGFRLVRELSAK